MQARRGARQQSAVYQGLSLMPYPSNPAGEDFENIPEICTSTALQY